MPDTQLWPFVEARWFTKMPKLGTPGCRSVRLIVIHDMEFYEKGDSAEVIAHDFATRPATSKASAHICVDNNSVIQCVRDSDIAYASPGANHDGIQVELAGYMRQSMKEWLDFYGIALLALGSDAVAQYCIKFGISPVHLTNAQLRAGQRGIVGHWQVSEVYKKSDHTDPGPGFPWAYFIQSVQNFIGARREAA